MKKALAFTVLLLVISPVALVVAGWRVDSQKENIVITEKTLYGNPEEAAGIKVRMVAQWEEHLIWDTVYAMGSGETESSFSFSALGERFKEPGQEDISIDCVTGWGMVMTNGPSAPFDPDGYPLPRIVKALIERTQPGERRTETVRIADYYEYYPLQFYLHSEQFDVYYFEPGQTEDGRFTDFFDIPVSDSQTLNVTLEKDAEGEVIDVQCQADSDIHPISLAAFGREGCYHAYYLEEYAQGLASVLDGTGEEYGIYYYPYIEENNYNENLTIDPTQARKVCDLEPGIALAEMALSETEDVLYLVTKEGQDYYLNVYDVEEEELALRQRIWVRTVNGEMGTENNPAWSRLSVQEEGVLMVWRDGSFAFVADRGGEMEFWRLEQEPMPNPLFFHESVWDFDGQRLAFVSYVDWESVSVNLAVYRQEGLTFFGICEHSGDLGKDTGDTSLSITPPGTAGASILPAPPEGEAENFRSIRRRVLVEELLGVEIVKLEE